MQEVIAEEISVPASGRRLAFQDLKRQLDPKDLANPGTQKLILEMLINAEDERDELEEYVPMYHASERRAAVLEEKLKSNRLNEMLVNVGLGVGCAIIGLAPTFWKTENSQGPVCQRVCMRVVAQVSNLLYRRFATCGAWG